MNGYKICRDNLVRFAHLDQQDIQRALLAHKMHNCREFEVVVASADQSSLGPADCERNNPRGSVREHWQPGQCRCRLSAK